MTYTPTPGGLLLSAACDVRDRYLRLLHGVVDMRRTDDLGIRELLKDTETQLRKQLTTYEAKVANALQSADLEDAPANPDSWSGPYQKRIWDVTRNGFSALTAEQRLFFRHLTSGVLPPADIAYFLARSVGLSPTRPSHRQRFAVCNSQYSSWESTKVTTDTATPIIPIPFVETLTPLRWPLLVHELGHHVLPVSEEQRANGNDVTSRVMEAHLGGDTAVGRLLDLEETISDRVAERYCSSAFAMALLRESQLVSMAKHLGEQAAPKLLDRLRQLDYWPHLEPALPKPWRANLGDPVRDLSAVRETAVSLMEGREDVRPDVVDAVVALLLDNQPAPSVQLSPAPSDMDLARAAKRESSGISESEIESIFLAVTETACTDAEVLTAAWQIETCQPAEIYLADLGNSLLVDGELDEQRLVERRAALTRRDTAISRSLQAAAVHDWLQTHDAKIRANVVAAEKHRDQAAAHSTLASTTPPEEPAEPEGAAPTPESAPAPPAASPPLAVLNESSPLSDVQLVRRLIGAPKTNRLVIRPLIDPAQIGGTTIDLRLGTEWETMRTSRFKALNPIDELDDITTLLDSSVEQFRLTSGQNEGLVLHPGELMLALTLEYLRLPDDLWGNLEGRSTWARIGLQVHASAGMIDAGFDGYLTLELQNTSRLPLVLYPGLRVAQLAFFPVPGIARAYRRKASAAYSDQTSARTAFPRQHEHEALRAYHRAERESERKLHITPDA